MCAVRARAIVPAIVLALGLSIAASVTAGAADQTVRLAPHASSVIELQENPSTGYRWSIDAGASVNLSILRIGDLGFSQSGSAHPIGAPGVHRWRVEAVSTGSASIVFVYRRSWEQAPGRRHEVAVEAQ
jgi:inhibitor of cysteine peptidase